MVKREGRRLRKIAVNRTTPPPKYDKHSADTQTISRQAAEAEAAVYAEEPRSPTARYEAIVEESRPSTAPKNSDTEKEASEEKPADQRA